MNVDVRQVRTEAEQALATATAGFAGEAGWVDRARAEALDAFRAAGLPHRRIEQWKYTDLRAALKTAYPVAAPGKAGTAPADPLADAGFATLTFVDGALVGEVPEVDGVSIATLADALHADVGSDRDVLSLVPARGSNPVMDLNTAHMNSGCVVHVAPGAIVETPIHIRSLVTRGDPAGYVSRVGVIVGEGAQATILESFGGAGAYQRNSAIQIAIGDGAKLHHVRIEDEADEAVHLSNIVVEIGGEADYQEFGLGLGGALVRTDLSIKFDGEGSNADVDSVFLKTGRQHHDTTMYVDHAVPNCTSRELFKSVLGGQSHGVFQGKILVRPDAQKTDGAMSANAIMLSDTAEMDAKPELEIFADDVVCGHGATCGQLDDDLMFFLRARGIPERDAKALLILAFIGEALEDVDNETVHDHLLELTRTWIEKADI